MPVPKPENIAYTEPERLPYVPERLLTEADYDIAAQSWRRGTTDKGDANDIGMYYGKGQDAVAAQTGILVNNNAAERLRTEMPYVFDALVANDVLAGHVYNPALLNARVLPGIKRTDMWFDPQYRQPTGSFKDRGAAYAVMTMSAEERRLGVKTSSHGNHGGGLARVGQRYGVPVAVYVPANTSEAKKQRIISLGAELIEVASDDYEAAEAACLDPRGRHAAARVVPPYNSLAVMIGQSGIAVNQFDHLPSVQNVVYPVGGGGLLGRSAAVLKQLRPDIHVYGVVHEDANAPRLSKLAGRIINIGSAGRFSEGTSLQEPGSLTFPYLSHFVDDILEVDTLTTARSMQSYYEATGVRLEAAGALAIAAMQEYASRLDGPTIYVLSGANPDQAAWSHAIRLAGRNMLLAS